MAERQAKEADTDYEGGKQFTFNRNGEWCRRVWLCARDSRVLGIDRIGEDVSGGGLNQERRVPDEGCDRVGVLARAWLPRHLGDVCGPPRSTRQQHARHGRKRLQRRAGRIEKPLPVKVIASWRHQGLILHLILLTAFSVVLGTLAIQGLTLGPLLRALDLHDDDPVGHEVALARDRALRAGLARLKQDQSPTADAVRQEFTSHLGSVEDNPTERETRRSAHRDIHRQALQAARQAVLAMRANEEIGDDA